MIPLPGAEPTSLCDKITRTKFASSLFDFGGSPIEGVFAVTRTGRFILKTLGLYELANDIVHSKPLCIISSSIKFADFAFEADGSIIFTISSGIVSKPIRFVRVNLSKKNPFQIANRSRTSHQVGITSEEISPLYIIKENLMNEFACGTDVFLTDLQFPHKEYPDQVIIRYINVNLPGDLKKKMP